LEKIKISAVSYLNTLPFIYGIEQDLELLNQIELSKDMPSECARKLIDGEVDLGLIPVAAIPELAESHIISDYCIGAVGKVKSVLLLSNVPIEKIETIYLDYQSRTSVKLCRILCEHHWKVKPVFLNSEAGYEQKIEGNTAGVIIGDRTFYLEKKYSHQYDLAEEWQKMTGLPFVFAAWVSNRKLPAEFVEEFNKAIYLGVNDIELVVNNQEELTIPRRVLMEYFTKNISYELDDEKKEGLKKFLSFLRG